MSPEPDARHDVRRARDGHGVLGDFGDAGLLVAADVHVARRLVALAGEEREEVALAAALAVRAPRLGHVFVDLATVARTAVVDDAAAEAAGAVSPPWPDPDAWIARTADSPLVAHGEEATADRPLRLVGSRLYLDRYWREERGVAEDLAVLAAEPPAVDEDALADGVGRLLRGLTGDPGQRRAAASAVLRRLTVVGGGPGTGKTTTVSRIVALLLEQATALGEPAPLVALAAPTGKAAARLEEALHAEAGDLDVHEDVRHALLGLHATTLHRLLGWRPGSHSRFRHHGGDRLPHDVVVVDETSMVSLSLMGRLVEAVRPGARLVLVGDPGQLASVEAGAVLGDVVGRALRAPQASPAAEARLAAATGDAPAEPGPSTVPARPEIADGVVVLRRPHRYGGAIAAVADAVRAGDADATVAALADHAPEVIWLPVDVTGGDPDLHARLGPVREGAVAAGRGAREAALRGDAGTAIAALRAFRVLCAHRRGPAGVAHWSTVVEGWVGPEEEAAASGEAIGRPLLVTANDHELRLYNGDVGVVVRSADGRARAAFDRASGPLEVAPGRLGAVETVHAMTIHKSQGSQFGAVAVLLPEPGSRILTRELLYTAVTRARERLIVVGPEATVRAAVERPVARASGLRERLWGAEPG